MQISRRVLPLASAAAVALLPLVLFSQDTGTDSKLREALAQKMKELQSQPPSAPAQMTPAAAQTAAPSVIGQQPTELENALRQRMNETQSQPVASPVVAAPEPAPQAPARPRTRRARPDQEAPAMTVAPTQPVAAAPAQPVAETGSSSALEDALHQKMSQAPMQPSAPAVAAPTAAPPVVSSAPAQTAAPESSTALEQALQQKMQESRPVVSTPPVTAPTTPGATTPPWQPSVQPETNPEAEAKLREALQQKMSNSQAQQPASANVFQPVQPQVLTSPTNSSDEALERAVQNAQSKPVPTQPQTQQPAIGGSVVLPPLPAPPPAVSAAKQQQLDELLQKYMADLLTPEQYHEQRAKILAKP